MRSGFDLNREINGVRLATMVFGNMYREGDVELLNFAVKVAKHFQSTDNLDSDESKILRRNVGAKSPQDLLPDGTGSTVEGRELYLRHIVERACALLDAGECEASFIFKSTDDHEFQLKQIANDPELRPIATTFKLYLMRACEPDEEQEALKIFQQEQQWIPKNYKYSCGCTLVHDACIRGNLPLLEALDQSGFDLTTTNKKGEAPLHWSVCCWSHVCIEFLLKRFLGEFYVPVGAKREQIVARSPQEQKFVEDALGSRDVQGRTPLLYAADLYACNVEFVVYNLLGPLMVTPLMSEEHVSRTEYEQREVERILDVRDVDNSSILHALVVSSDKLSFLRFTLKNLLGEFFIDRDCRTSTKRGLQRQQQIAQLLQPKNQVGATPLLTCATSCVDDRNMHCLFLRNLLGEYFVHADGSTERPLRERSEQENQFVRGLMFGEDEDGRSPYVVAKETCVEQVKLLYEGNARYLLKKPTRCHIS
jgi:hypothetical protein